MFGKQIREARTARGWSQADLAKKANMPPSQIGHYESNSRSPSAENLVELAVALGVSIDILAGGKPNQYDRGFRDGYFQCREDMKAATKTRLQHKATP